MNEWIDIKDFEGLYQLNKNGDIKSLEHGVIRSNRKKYHVVERLLKIYINKQGYKYVILSKNGKDYVKKIHRLIAEHFIPNPNNYPEVNHKNEIKTDNSINNLEWCTHKYNINYSHNTEKAGMSLARKVIAIDINNTYKFNSIQEAARKLNCDASSICKVLRGKLKTHKNYYFFYGN